MRKLELSTIVEQLAPHWGRRPAVLRDVLPEPLFDARTLFDGISLTAKAMLTGTDGPSARAYVGKRKLTESDPELMSLIPRPELNTLDEYAAQIAESFPGEELAIILDECENAVGRVRTNVSPLLDALFERVGYPMGTNHTCVYAGTYSATPFGIHMDLADILLFVGVGTKRLAFWPREQFERMPEVYRAGQSDLNIPVQEHLATATVLEVGPRDILYWPPEFWHVGLGDGGTFHASLSVAMFHRGSGAEIFERMLANEPPWATRARLQGFPLLDGRESSGFHVEDTLGRLARECLDGATFRPFRDRWSAVAEMMNRVHEVDIRLARRMLMISTSAGFGATLQTNPPIDVRGSRLSGPRPRALAYAQVGEQAVVGANGNTFVYSNPRDVIGQLIARLRSDEPLLVDDFLSSALPEARDEAVRVMGDALAAGALNRA